jgi:ABC-2 type transport system ATP-binding protein
VGIIDHGKIIALDVPTSLKKSMEQLDIVQLEVENFDPACTDALNQLPSVQNVVYRHLGTDSTWSVGLHTMDSRAVLPGLIEIVGSRAGRIKHLQVTEPTLEDVFISLTGKKLRD